MDAIAQRQFDVFIAHVDKDKHEVARPLVQALMLRRLRVWYDELELQVGEDPEKQVMQGLANSSFGVVILSRYFFEAPWARRELDTLLARASSNDTYDTFILPIWHGVSRDEVMQYSPTLGHKVGLHTGETPIEDIAEAISKIVGKRATRSITPPIAPRASASGGYAPPIAPKRHHQAESRPDDLESLFASPTDEVTVAVIGGQRLLREATASLLSCEEGLRVLATFESVADYRSALSQSPPMVLLLDCEHSEPAVWQSAISELCSSNAESRVALLCSEIRKDLIHYVIEHGVSGIILKSYTVKEMREAIAYIARGKTIMPAGWQRGIASGEGKAQSLSPRQRQILGLIAHGRGNHEIAAELGLSRNTVKFHLRTLYARLDVRNRVEAANQYAKMTPGSMASPVVTDLESRRCHQILLVDHDELERVLAGNVT
ncbi:MAG TPA: LuxR C-terminal-related transcriptional regulator [Solirubrobacteraceae bacterium]